MSVSDLDPPHRRQRLRRRPASPRARGRRRPLRCLARRPEYLRSKVATRHRGRGGRRAGSGSLGRRSAACTPRTTWSTRWRRPATMRRTTDGAPSRSPRPRARPACGGSSTWAGSAGRAALPPPREPAGGRPDPPRVGRPDDRVPRLDRHRLGQPLVRAGARAGREAAGDGHAALGGHARPSRSASRTWWPISSRRSTCPRGESVVYEIGGPDRVSYGDLMREYGRLRGLRRVMLPVPVLTPRLSSLWLALVSPVYARVGRELIDGVRNETVVRGRPRAARLRRAPARHSRGARAGAGERGPRASPRPAGRTRSPSQRAPRSWGGVTFGSRRVDSRAAWVHRPPDEAFRPIARIGGKAGWYYGNRLWRLRGLLDCWSAGPACGAAAADPELGGGGRGAGLLAGRGGRARPPAAARRRDAPAGTRLAAVRGDARERRQPDPADGALRSGRAWRDWSTGTGSGGFTNSCSRACCGTSPVRPWPIQSQWP